MTNTNRRTALALLGAGAGSAALLPRATQAQEMPRLRWRLASSFPKSLNTIFGATEYFTRRVAQLTEGRFEIRPFAAGEIVPALQVLDAVSTNTMECGHTGSFYYIGKNPAFAFGTAIPFGMNMRQHNAWLYHGGGNELLNAFYKQYKIHAIPLGNTGAQMGGWFRKELRSAADLNGLKMRVGGIAGQIMARLGLVPQQIAAGDIYTALEKGTIDAAEWVGPFDDEKLGFQKVAPFYYYPGFNESSTVIHLFVNQDAWTALPPLYQAVVETAAAEAHTWMTARYDAENPAALRRLLAGGTKLRAYPSDLMDAAYRTAQALYAELAEKNPEFKTLLASYNAFQALTTPWFQVAEDSYANFIARTLRAAAKR